MELFSPEFLKMAIRLMLNLLVSITLVHCLYYPKSKRRNYYFTFMMISVAIFFLVYSMIYSLEDMKTKTSIGIGIGLFGIFSIMRYRTDAMPVREMTYLFVIISLSVVNAIAAEVSVIELVSINLFVILTTFILERGVKVYPSKLIQYDRIALIKPEKYEELLADLVERTGLDIVRVEVGSIDFLKDMAMIKIYYRQEGKVSNEVDQKLKLRREDLTTV